MFLSYNSSLGPLVWPTCVLEFEGNDKFSYFRKVAEFRLAVSPPRIDLDNWNLA